jgi:septal ring factor EnvC (AmiA/AmiB activator)
VFDDLFHRVMRPRGRNRQRARIIEPSRAAWPPRALLSLLAAAALPFAAPPAWPQQQDARQTEAELKEIRKEIERVRRQVSRDQVERNKLTRQLREAEMSAGAVRESLERVRRERTELATKRSELAAEKKQQETELAQERASLAGQLRAAYLIGREEPLKLLLNQKDPARAGRMFAYYGYFGRARAAQIDRISAAMLRVDELDAQMAEADRQLASLEAERRDELDRLEGARAKRNQVLVSLNAETRTRAQNLERLKKQQSGLEALLRELKRAMERLPSIDSGDAFARLRGKLAWPVAGRVVARFGEQRAGGLKWDGVLVATERGASVRAVSHGRVVYADWLPGLGLLAIVDPGEGYLSLYGHNDRLYKSVGERVVPGDPIAAAGDSGGSSRPELYFEIRKGGRPVDPRPWFRSSAPAD